MSEGRMTLDAAVREARAAAWDEGYDTGRDDQMFDERGLSTDSDAHEYPHSNPYRATAPHWTDEPHTHAGTDCGGGSSCPAR